MGHHITPEIRKLIVSAKRRCARTKDIAKMFNVHRKTVWKWCKRAKHRGRESFKDKSKRPKNIKKKTTIEIENAIIVLREAFNWGTQRIKVYLQTPPEWIEKMLKRAIGDNWKCEISRQAINNILKKHGINGSPYYEVRNWKYFRADYPNELWQIDIRGAFTLEGQRYYMLLVIDDNSRYFILCKLFKSITTEVIAKELRKCFRKYGKPKKVLVDNGSQFKEQFERFCKWNKVEFEHTPKHYPQSKGKIERSIRTINEEYIRFDKVFDTPSLFIDKWVEWFNDMRFHMGIGCCPSELYFGNVTDVG